MSRIRKRARPRVIVAGLTIAVLLFAVTAIVSAQGYAIGNYVFGNGGGVVREGNVRVAAVLGEDAVGRVVNDTLVLQSGAGLDIPGLRWTDVAVEVDYSASVPRDFRLDQNYPNPFNPTTTIEFAIMREATVALDLYNILGQRVRTLVEGDLPPGEYRVELDATDLPSGVYLYRLRADTFTQTRKLVLLK
jgi:hypothetical protein